MRPSTFVRATWVLSDKAEVSCPTAKVFKRSSVGMQYFIRSSTLVNLPRATRHHHLYSTKGRIHLRRPTLSFSFSLAFKWRALIGHWHPAVAAPGVPTGARPPVLRREHP